MQELFFQWVVRFGFMSVHLVEIYIKEKTVSTVLILQTRMCALREKNCVKFIQIKWEIFFEKQQYRKNSYYPKKSFTVHVYFSQNL